MFIFLIDWLIPRTLDSRPTALNAKNAISTWLRQFFAQENIKITIKGGWNG